MRARTASCSCLDAGTNHEETEKPDPEPVSYTHLDVYKRQIWTVPTHILYGEKDNLTSYETIAEFAHRIGATLTVMENGEHWFHTKEQMDFLSDWIKPVSYTHLVLKGACRVSDVHRKYAGQF